MMKQAIEVPKVLYPLEFHGVEFAGKSGSNQLIADCIFCGAESKFHANKHSGLWDCKRDSCGRSGNVNGFLEQFWEESYNKTETEDWERLAALRGLPEEVLCEAQLAWTGEKWILPVRGANGTAVQLQCWNERGGKLLNTKGLKSQLFGLDRLQKEGTVYLCEGAWDALALRALLGTDENIIGVPGAQVWLSAWKDIQELRGREVAILYDKGAEGRKARAALEDMGCSVRQIVWPEELPDGTDIRDFFRADNPLETLLELIKEPSESAKTTPRGESISWQTLQQTFGRYLHMDAGLQAALRVIFATALSERIPGDPLWLFLIGPPGAGKTELLNSLGALPHCHVISNVTPAALISGQRGPDVSLIPKLKNGLLIIKDFTEILQLRAEDREKIMATLRGCYDGYASRVFGTGETREYKNVHFSVIAAVTEDIQRYRQAMLGERFVSLWVRPASGQTNTMAALERMTRKGEMREALQDAALRFLENVKVPADWEELTEVSNEAFAYLANLVTWIRGTVTMDWRQEEPLYRPEREVGTRLAQQLKKLYLGLRLLEGDTADSFALVKQVALDCCAGWSWDIISALIRAGGVPVQAKDLAQQSQLTLRNTRKQLELLEMRGLVHWEEGEYAPSVYKGQRPKNYFLSQQLEQEIREADQAGAALKPLC